MTANAQKNTATVTLQEPVTYGEKTYTHLTVRKMRAKDLVAQDLVTGEVRGNLALLASITGVPLPVIEDLDIDDLARLTEAMQAQQGGNASAGKTEVAAPANTQNAATQ